MNKINPRTLVQGCATCGTALFILLCHRAFAVSPSVQISDSGGCCWYIHGYYNNVGPGIFLEGVLGGSCFGDGQTYNFTDNPYAVAVNNCPYKSTAWATWPGFVGATNGDTTG